MALLKTGFKSSWYFKDNFLASILLLKEQKIWASYILDVSIRNKVYPSRRWVNEKWEHVQIN